MFCYSTVRRGSAKTRCEARLRIWIWRHRCRQKIREAFPHSPKRMNFRKSSDPKNCKTHPSNSPKAEDIFDRKTVPNKTSKLWCVPKNQQYFLPKMRGGSKAVWNFSEKRKVFRFCEECFPKEKLWPVIRATAHSISEMIKHVSPKYFEKLLFSTINNRK